MSANFFFSGTRNGNDGNEKLCPFAVLTTTAGSLNQRNATFVRVEALVSLRRTALRAGRKNTVQRQVQRLFSLMQSKTDAAAARVATLSVHD